ncbi:MAG TPA: hypothetical protein VIL37_14235 [Natronosporangium sp.]
MDGQFGRTRFEDYPHSQLAEMLAAGQPAQISATADGWRQVANLLDDAALALEREHREFRDYWEGAAADAHSAMITSLVDGVRQVAWVARRTSDQLFAATEALRLAQERMAALGPPMPPVPPDQAVLAAAAAPLPYGRARVDAAAQQLAAVRAVRDYQRAQAAAAAATSAAVAILDELRNTYLNLEIPPAPAVAEPPTIAPDGSPLFPPATGGPPPLFTGVWANGLAAAAGLPPAQLLQPYLPVPGAPPAPGSPPSGVDGPAPGRLPGELPTGRATVPGMDGAAGAGSAPGLGPRGGLDGGLPGGGGLGPLPGADLAFDPDRAVGMSSAAPSIGPETAAGLADGGAGPATAGAPFIGGGFIPPMGMGMMGAGGAGGGAASAAVAWLVSEVEEFGVKSPVVPEVIG